MRIAPAIPLVLLGMAPMLTQAAESLDLDNGAVRSNYVLGYQFGSNFKQYGETFDAAAVLEGIEDALSGAEPLMSQDEMRSARQALRQKLAERQRAIAAEQRREQTETDRKFLEDNAKQPGIATTESGLQYLIVEEGTGKTPIATDKVTVHYRGTLTDGEEFDSSYSRGKPATFPLNGVIKGWTEGLQLIKEGGKIKLFVPEELAYGDRGRLAHRTLVFDVELISVGDNAPGNTPSPPGN